MQAFFTERLIGQRQASPHTIAAYRDTFRLLLEFAQQRTGIRPHALDVDDLDAELVTAFPGSLEQVRGNSARTRNTRLAAIRSLYHYATLRHPEHAATIARVLAIPTKRHDRAIVSYLDEPETTALLAAPDRSRWIGRRDHALMTLTIQTGLRVCEVIALRCQDAHLAGAAHPGNRQGPQAARYAADHAHQRHPAPLDQGARRPPRPAPCFRPAAEARSAATRSPCSSAGTPRPPAATARRWLPRRSHRTCCATPRR